MTDGIADADGVLTATSGPVTGETFAHFPVARGDHVLADRGHSTAAGLAHVASAGGHVTVRVNTGALPLRTTGGAPFDLPAAVGSLKRAGAARSWPAVAVGDGIAVPGRVCAIRKTREATAIAHRKLRETTARKGNRVQPRTLEFASHVIVFTTFPEARFTAAEVLEWYRVRWQAELVFKRFKSLAQPGHVPKHGDESARAWLHGELLVALLVEKPIRHASAVSPWGCDPEAASSAQPVA